MQDNLRLMTILLDAEDNLDGSDLHVKAIEPLDPVLDVERRAGVTSTWRPVIMTRIIWLAFLSRLEGYT